jgi:hypothetical protein
MIHVVVMKCLIGLPLLIHTELLWSRSRSFKNWGVGFGAFVYRLHSPAADTSKIRVKTGRIFKAWNLLLIMTVAADGILETRAYSFTATLTCWVYTYTVQNHGNLHVIRANLCNSEEEDFSEMERITWRSNEIQPNSVITSWNGFNILCRYKRVSL